MTRLFLLLSLTMIMFAANSVLNRAALLNDAAGPAAFAALRLVSGAVCLLLLITLRSGLPAFSSPGRAVGVGSLLLYMIGFSYAYVSLDAGVGALILFGGVQLTMFCGAILEGERMHPSRWIGAAVAFGGLVWLLMPEGQSPTNLVAGLAMIFAAVGWGIYSLAGRKKADALGETTANFVMAAPVALLVWAIWPDGMTTSGALLAILSGAITSGLGYALWYTVLPRLEASVAALAQLTVPVIALAAGTLLLAEAPTLISVLASAVVLGGVAVGVLGSQRMIGSRGS